MFIQKMREYSDDKNSWVCGVYTPPIEYDTDNERTLCECHIVRNPDTAYFDENSVVPVGNIESGNVVDITCPECLAIIDYFAKLKERGF